MTPEEFEHERRISAETLAGIVEGTGDALVERAPESILGPEGTVRKAEKAASAPEERRPWSPPPPPDLRPVNTSWQTQSPAKSGAIASLIDRSGAEYRSSQVKFNSDQVQLDNQLVQWTGEHFAATHRHYDALIRSMQERMDDIDTRHRELEREVVRHVHEMARRIDLVLGEGEKGRVSHEGAIRSIRDRLRAIEEKLA